MKSVSIQNAQSYLSIGYVYLVAMGVLKEALYYNQFGINILNYSSVLDVLVSPIASLTSSPIMLGAFIVILVIIFIFTNYLTKNRDKSWFKKSFKIEGDNNEENVKNQINKLFFTFFSIGIFSFFVGTGIGEGIKVADKIESDEIQYDDTLTFISGDNEEVNILGTNSAYIFYLSKGNKAIKITPFNGIVKSIEKNAH